jgi:hypothetical protein
MAIAYFFIDYTNGNDARTGLRIPAGDYNSTSYNIIDSVPDDTHFIDAALTGGDDYITGSYVWNVTKGQGRLITVFDSGSDRVEFGIAMSPIWEAGDSYYILDSWKTINKYTTTTARTAGDKAYLRANMTHTQGAANITIDEHGSESAYIYVIGCNATQLIDPWHDASDLRPIIDFNAGAYNMVITKSFWTFRNIDIRNNNLTSVGMVAISGASINRIYFTNCRFYDSAHASSYGVAFAPAATTISASDVVFTDCAFTNCKQYDVYLGAASYVAFIRCTFDSGANATEIGALIYACRPFFKDCNFGKTSSFATSDVWFGGSASSKGIFRNCRFTSSPGIGFSASWSYCSVAVSEDHNGVSGANGAYTRVGSVVRSTTELRTGGASTSALMIPSNSNIANNYPLSINGDMYDPDFKVWCPEFATTIAIYMRSYGTWTTVPTNTELYIEAEYVTDDTTDAITRTTSTSTQTLTQASQSDWVAFTITITPHIASFVNLKVYLSKYESTSQGVYVDIKPIVS